MSDHYIEVTLEGPMKGYRDEFFYSAKEYFVISKTCDFANGSTYLAKVREYEGAIVLANYYAMKLGAEVRDKAGPKLLGKPKEKGKKG